MAIESLQKKENTQEKSKINLDKMYFRYISEEEITEQLKAQKSKRTKEEILKTIEHISERFEEIVNEITERLSNFLPDFEAPSFEVVFTINRFSNFMCKNGVVEIDLARLVNDKNILKSLKTGITHEVSHIWLGVTLNKKATNEQYTIINQDKFNVLRQIFSEGLALFVSEDDLEFLYKNHFDNRPYNSKEAFEKFNNFLYLSNEKEIESVKKEGFEAMGFFYLVGNEIFKTVIKHFGIGTVKEILKKPDILEMFEKYDDACKLEEDFPKIDLENIKKILIKK